MLIRISGGKSGIKEYLENGQKQYRFYSRDQLDERVILYGNLSLTDYIIKSLHNNGDKYFHITLAFKEDYIEPNIIEKINQEFKEYFLTTYAEDEINYYAEAHLPKIKSYRSSLDSALIERKPHIHIVIPQVNLIDGTSFKPSITSSIKYINAFQECINAKYGLASPKDNLRIKFNDSSEAISGYKGDIFTGKSKEQKNSILQLILANNPANIKQLKDLLIDSGYEVKIRNQNDPKTRYLNVKSPNENKGINLKDLVFRNEFLNLSLDHKIQKLNSLKVNQYTQNTVPNKMNSGHQNTMQEWLNFQALEIRFINRRSSKATRLNYKQLSKEDKINYLNKLKLKLQYYNKQANFLESNQNGRNFTTNTGDNTNVIISNETTLNDLKTDITRIRNLKIGNNLIHIRKSFTRISEKQYRAYYTNNKINEQSITKSSVLDELSNQNDEYFKSHKFKNYLHELNSNIHANVLLELTEKTHGVQPELYFITKDKNGSDRIKCGNRNLSLVDFCLKELNLNFKESIKLLDNVYNMQHDLYREHGYNINQNINLKDQYKVWLEIYKSDRLKLLSKTLDHVVQKRKTITSLTQEAIKLLREDKELSLQERKIRINILKANKVVELNALHKAKLKEQKSINEKFNFEMQASYRKFLSEQATLGDEIALKELRRLRIKFDKQQNDTNNAFLYIYHYQEFRLNISYEIDVEGNICYKLNNKLIIKDIGKKIEVKDIRHDNIKLGLELAIAKFGRKIELTGSEEFKRKTIEIAIKCKFKIEFIDNYSKTYHYAYSNNLKHKKDIFETTKLIEK